LFVVFLGSCVGYEMADFIFGDGFFLYVDMVSGAVSASCPPSIIASGDQATETSNLPHKFIYSESQKGMKLYLP
jgi:hypothetical protein